MSDTTIKRRGSDLLAVGFGATVTLWAVLYFCLMPGVNVPGDVVVGLMGVVLISAGFVLGRHVGRTWRGGIAVGVIAWSVNMLVLTSLLGGDKPGEIVTDALVWIAGFAVAAIVFVPLGTWAGSRFSHPSKSDWHAAFPTVAACTTACLITAGGVVTGLEAGLAVPDWPNSFGHSMIFFPLTLMQRDGHVYAEHAHRLWGMLVGLTAIVLMVQTFRTDRRAWVRALTVVTFIAVCGQGVLGGLRVTEISTPMAMAHGVFGQMIFALMVAIAVVCTRVWRHSVDVEPRPGAGLDRKLAVTLLALVLIQLVLGAAVRHFASDHALLTHIAVATVVFVLGIVVTMRAMGLHGSDHPALKRVAIVALGVLFLQVALGFGALIATSLSAESDERTYLLADVIVTTLHQANGALLLGATTALMLLCFRLLRPGAAARMGDSPNDAPAAPAHADPAHPA